MSYKIAVGHGSAFNSDGTPQQHTLMRILKTFDLVNSGDAQEAYFCGLNEGKRMYNYAVSRLGLNPDLGHVESGSWSTVSNMARVGRAVNRRIKRREIPSDVVLKLVTTDWAKPRFEFDADWVLKNYPHEVIGVGDGRLPNQIDQDVRREETAFLIDRLSSKIPIFSTYDPELAQRLVLGVGGVIKDPETGNWNYRNLAWTLFGAVLYGTPAAIRILSGNLDVPVLPEILPSSFSSVVPGYPLEKLIVNFIAPGGVGAAVVGEFLKYFNWERRDARLTRYLTRVGGAAILTGLFTALQTTGYNTQLGGDIWESPRAYPFNLVYGTFAGSLAPYVPELVRAGVRKLTRH